MLRFDISLHDNNSDIGLQVSKTKIDATDMKESAVRAPRDVRKKSVISLRKQVN